MDSFSILPLPFHGGGVERTQLLVTFHAPTRRDAAVLAAELHTIAACVPQLHAVKAQPSPRSDWIVTFTTPPVPLTLIVLQRWEVELLEFERRFAGCRFLGWRTQPTGSLDATETGRGGAVAMGEQRSQRKLVLASMLRLPPSPRGQGACKTPALRVRA